VSCVKPFGGFYIFPNFDRFGMSALDLSLRLIEEAGVIALPGTEFGPAGEGYLRLSAAAAREQVEKGIEGMTRFVWAFDTQEEPSR
jgi:aspartate/methionine/tyrosine aminotransferase